MPKTTAPEIRERAIAAALEGATLRQAGALVGVDAGTVSRWVNAAPADIRAALATPQREELGRAYLAAAERASAVLERRLADTEEPIREIAYCLRTYADIALRILGWQQDAARATYIGGQHLHAGNQAPALAELSDAELDARIAAARAVSLPVVNETE